MSGTSGSFKFQAYQGGIDVGNRQELVVHLVDLLVLQPAFFKVREGEVKQSVATQHAADRPLENVGDLVVENLRGVCVLQGEAEGS